MYSVLPHMFVFDCTERISSTLPYNTSTDPHAGRRTINSQGMEIIQLQKTYIMFYKAWFS